MREISSFTRLAEPGQQNQLGAHPRAIGLDAAALDTALTLAVSALSVLPPTHETVLLAGSGTSVLTNMTSTKALQRRSLEINHCVNAPVLPGFIAQLNLSPLRYLHSLAVRISRLGPRARPTLH